MLEGLSWDGSDSESEDEESSDGAPTAMAAHEAARKHDAGKASSTSRREVGAALPEPERATPPTAPAGDTPSRIESYTEVGAAEEEGTANSEEEGAAAAAAAPAKTRRGGTGARKKVRARAKKAGKR